VLLWLAPLAPSAVGIIAPAGDSRLNSRRCADNRCVTARAARRRLRLAV